MKKRILSLVVILSMLMSCAPIVANAAIVDSGTCGDNLTWELDDNGTLTIRGMGNMEDYGWWNAAPWESNRSDIKTVVIQDGVTTIGWYAFEGCSGLTSVTIPDSVTSIGDYAFSYCDSLTSITIPDNVTSIDDGTFEGCSGLTSIAIPDRVTSIGDNAFADCSGLTSIIIPNSVTSIGNSVFRDCTRLESIIIPDSVTTIGAWAFEGCTGLTSINVDSANQNYCSMDGNLFNKSTNILIQYAIGKKDKSYTIPDSVTTIDGCAFEGCSGLTSITIPNGVTSIGYLAFDGCSGLTSITIPSSVTTIGNQAFYDCTSLTSITIPDNVTFIDDGVFEGCSGLTSITIPDSVTSIGNNAFEDCSDLTSITIPNGVTSIGYSVFAGCSGLTSITIPDSVTSIGNNAFEDCSDLTSITIPNGVTSIGYSVFAGCSSLTSITIPDNVTSIDDGVFAGCISLTSVTIPNGVTSIGYSVFRGCSGLTSITIPDSVTSIGDNAFEDCYNLKDVYITALAAYLNIDFGAWDSNPMVYAYNLYLNNQLITGDLVIPNGVTKIPDYTFKGCSGLTSIAIPDSVTTIGDSALSGCSGLKDIYITDLAAYLNIDFGAWDSNPMVYAYNLYLNNQLITGDLVIPNEVTKIPDHTFKGCSGLTSITIPNSVTTIGDSALSGCSGLKDIYITDLAAYLNIDFGDNPMRYADNLYLNNQLITGNLVIPNGITKIPDYTFKGCSGLTSITIPDSVTTIGAWAFDGCSGLTSIIIPDSVTTIGDGAFKGCSGLTSVTIPNSVTSIGNSAFRDCSGLTSIIIPDSATTIGVWAFDGCTGLTSINVDSANQNYCSIDGNLFNKSKNLLIQYAIGKKDKSYTIPGSITSIGDGAFAWCSSLTSVNIPDSVISISSWAFGECSGLTSVNIPDSVTSIGYLAFVECSSLTSVNIPDSVTSIGVAFTWCDNLTDVYYSGSEAQWREMSSNAGISSRAKIHYNSGKSYTPVNANPSKPNSGGSGYSYGISGGRGHKKTTDVRERLKNSADTFNKAALEYTAAVSKSAKKQVGTDDDIESLANKLKTENRILFTSSPDAKTKKAAYIGYAKYLNQMIEEGISLNKINLSDNSVMIDYKLTNQILSKLRGKKLSYEYKGYTIKINSLAISKSYFGTLDVFTPKGGRFSAMISSDTNKTMADLQDFANQLKDVAQDVNKKALRAVVSDLVNLTGLGDLGKLIARDGLKSYKPLTKLGYGDVVKNVKKCYSGYEAVKDILNCTKIEKLDDIIDNPKKLSKRLASLCENESNIENAVVNAAQDKVIDSLYNLLYDAQAYEEMRDGKQPTFQESVKGFFEKTTSWISSIFQCPVDFTVYDKNGEMIGYVDDGAVYYNDDIYIEVSGDVKTLYVPVGMKVDIKMTGIDEGEFNYIVEEVIYNQPTGRLNYYGLPLSEGVEYTQNLDTTEFDNSTDVLPITSQDRDVLPNEYISSEDTTAYVIINTDSNDGGTVLGSGEYAKGDSVELSAVPVNSNYEFNGWYVNDELISVDNIYRFTAIENTDIYAEFMRVYNEDTAYEMKISDTVNDMYSYIYKDSDGSKGVVLVPFAEEVADDMTIHITTYSVDGSVLNSDITCSATLNENSIYAFDNIDLGNAVKVVIKDENSREIASADYNGSNEIVDTDIEVLGKYSESLNVAASEELGNVIVKFSILDDTINQNDIVAYLAEYDDNGTLLSCTILDETPTEQGMEFDMYLGDNYKLMFWDKNMCPITEVITSDLFGI